MNMNKVRWFGALLLVLALVPACGNKSVRPTSWQAEVVESLDGNRVRVNAIGVGDDTDEAKLDGFRAAVNRVAQDLVQSQEERFGWEASSDEVFGKAGQYIESYKIKSRRKEGDIDVKLTLDLVVNRKRLNDDLVAMGVLKAQRELLSDLKNPSIVVIAEDAVKTKAWRRLATDHVTGYLTTRKFEVLDEGQVTKLQGMSADTRAAVGTAPDAVAQIALQLGGDIYIVYDVKVDRAKVGRDGTVKASASARAFETTTARSIGSATGFSREYAATAGSDEKAVAEALSDAIDRVLVNVMDYWKDDAIKGFQFLIEVRGDFKGDGGEKIRRDIYRIVKETAPEFKENLATDRSLNYRVWYKGSNTDLLFALQDRFESATGRKLKSVSQNRKLIQLEVQ